MPKAHDWREFYCTEVNCLGYLTELREQFSWFLFSCEREQMVFEQVFYKQTKLSMMQERDMATPLSIPTSESVDKALAFGWIFRHGRFGYEHQVA